jgi:hypothetical protein
VNDGEFGLAAFEQRQRIDDESRNDVEFHLGPQRSIGVHRRHQPVEAIVALHCNTQRSGVALGQAGDIAAGFGDLGQARARQFEQALADGRKAQRPHVFLDQRGP